MRGAPVLANPVSGAITMNPVIAYTLLDNFEALGSRTVTAGAAQSIVSPGVLGSGQLQVAMAGVNTPSITNPNIGVGEAPAAWDLIGFCIDVGSDPANQSVGQARMTVTTGGQAYAYQVDAANGGALPSDFAYFSRGKRWLTFKANRLRVTNWAGAQLPAAAAASKQVAIQLQNPSSNRNGTVKVDALIRPNRQKSIIMLTADDVNTRQYSEMGPILDARSTAAGLTAANRLRATGFAAMGLFGSATKLTLAEALALKNTFGWDWSIDSGPFDESLLGFLNPAAAVAQLNAHRDAVVAAGLCASAESAKHLCYSYGASCYSATSVSTSITPNGGANYTLSNAALWGINVAAGMVAKNTGATGYPVVVQTPYVTSSTVQVQFDRVLPAGGARTVTFCGIQRGLAVTCTGAVTIACDTSGLVPGMTMAGSTVPTDTVIVSIDVESASGQITVSNAVPATCMLATFYLKDAPFMFGKLPDALIAAGYRSGRKVAAGNGAGFWPWYGLDPLFAMELPSISTDDGSAIGTFTTLNKQIADFQEVIDNGRCVMSYMHFNSTQNAANFTTLADFLAARVAAGDCDVLTVAEGFARINLASPIA